MESGDSASGNGEAAASGARTTVAGVPATATPGPPRVHLIEADVQAAARIAGELPPDRFRASTSPSLAAGLAHLTSETADVVLLDLDLPDSKGVQTLERFRRVEPELPVVVIIQSDMPGLGPILVRAGAQDCVRRDGVDAVELANSIEFAIERQRLSRRVDENRTRELLTREVQLQLKDQVLSRVSHELRTPLSAIHEFLSLLADGFGGELNDEQRSYVDVALKSANQLDRMVSDLLDTSRIALGKIEIAERPVRLRDLVEDSVRLVMPSAKAKKQTLSVRLHLQDDLVEVDPHRITQVLVNLLENSVKFAPAEGQIRVTVGGVVDLVRVEVDDSGPGIAPEERGTVFESLHQLASHRTEVGLGLGLHIAKELVALHGGTIGVEESDLGGARFFFEIPGASAPGRKTEETNGLPAWT